MLCIIGVFCYLLQLKNIITENAMLRGKIATLKEHCQTAELETKASRETIMRLVSESEREQKQVDKYTLDMDKVRLVGCQICTVKLLMRDYA